MPLTHTRTFRVRHYECDAYGHLNNANYLRYMQESAYDASAAAGYDLDRYSQMGRQWLIRETEIEYLLPLYYNDRVAVKTWVADFRRATSRRIYEFHNTADGTLAARGSTNWAFLDAKTYRPVTIPAEMISAFMPEGMSNTRPPRRIFPKAPTPPPGVFSMLRKVRWHDIDRLGHVNNAVYLEYVEECGMQVLAAHGWSPERMGELGFAILVRKNHIQYRPPALLGDELEISTWAADVRRSSAVRYYRIQRRGDETPLVEIHALGVWVDLASGRPGRFPPQFLEDFKSNLVETA